MTAEPLKTTREMAAICRISTMTLIQWSEKGIIPTAIRVPNKSKVTRRFLASDVLDAIGHSVK